MSRPSTSTKYPSAVAGSSSSAKAKVLAQVESWRDTFMDCLENNRLEDDYKRITDQIVSNKMICSQFLLTFLSPPPAFIEPISDRCRRQ